MQEILNQIYSAGHSFLKQINSSDELIYRLEWRIENRMPATVGYCVWIF